MGGERVTVKNLQVVKVDAEKNLIYRARRRSRVAGTVVAISPGEARRSEG